VLFAIQDEAGLTLLHSGDHNYTRGLPTPAPPDVLMIKCGRVDPGYSIRQAVTKAIDAVKPRAVLAGHIAELGHLPGGGREPYAAAIEALAGAPTETAVLAWGEVYRCRR
jgi:hypothetical protein